MKITNFQVIKRLKEKVKDDGIRSKIIFLADVNPRN